MGGLIFGLFCGLGFCKSSFTEFSTKNWKYHDKDFTTMLIIECGHYFHFLHKSDDLVNGNFGGFTQKSNLYRAGSS